LKAGRKIRGGGSEEGREEKGLKGAKNRKT